MRILLTNDDGINAPGLQVLETIARKLTNEENILVIAPTGEDQELGIVSVITPTQIERISENRYSVTGYPADCVIAGIHHVMKNDPPSLILSGVNRGNNSQKNVLYSGTIGAALEGALQKDYLYCALAIFGSRVKKMSNPFNPSITHGLNVIQKYLIKTNPDSGYKVFYNVNFPPTENIKG